MTEYLKKIMEEIGFSDDACKYFMNIWACEVFSVN